MKPDELQKAPLRHRWTISEGRLWDLRHGYETTGKLSSQVFRVPSHATLEYGLHLRVIGEGLQRVLRFDVEFKGADKKYDARLKITVGNAYHTDIMVVFEPEKNFIKIPMGDVNQLLSPNLRFVVDGKMTVKVEGEVMVEWKPRNCVGISTNPTDGTTWAILKEHNHFIRMYLMGDDSIYYDDQKHYGLEDVKHFPMHCAVESQRYRYYRNNGMTLEDLFEDHRRLRAGGHTNSLVKMEELIGDRINQATVCQIAKFVDDEVANSELETRCLNFLDACMKHCSPVADLHLLPHRTIGNLLEHSLTTHTHILNNVDAREDLPLPYM